MPGAEEGPPGGSSPQPFRARAAGRRVMVCAWGSRGDAQPMVALVLGLQGAGFRVCLCVNANEVQFVESFGIEAKAVFTDMQQVYEENPELRNAVATGDMLSIAKGNKGTLKAHGGEELQAARQAVDDWKPDVIISAPICAYELKSIASVRSIPVVPALLQLTYPSKDLQSWFGEPLWFPHRLAGNLLHKLAYDQWKNLKEPFVREQEPEALEFTHHSFFEYQNDSLHPITPVLAGVSSCLTATPEDWSEDAKERVKLCGAWVLDQEAQVGSLARGHPDFGAEEHSKIEAFLAAGSPPVYMGWGSMMSSPRHMLLLALGSLMRLGRRGILMRGWSQIELGLLEGAPGAEALLRYAEENLLIIHSTAHEWLFPQCCCVVHHGGAGTSYAAFRAGVPSVITPVAFDQFGNGTIAARNGIGICTRQLSRLKEAELAFAVEKCLTDQGLLERCLQVCKELRAEEAALSAARIVDAFIVDELDTGIWRERRERQLRGWRRLRKGSPPGCCAWIKRLFFSREPNNFSLEDGTSDSESSSGEVEEDTVRLAPG